MPVCGCRCSIKYFILFLLKAWKLAANHWPVFCNIFAFATFGTVGIRRWYKPNNYLKCLDLGEKLTCGCFSKSFASKRKGCQISNSLFGLSIEGPMTISATNRSTRGLPERSADLSNAAGDAPPRKKFHPRDWVHDLGVWMTRPNF